MTAQGKVGSGCAAMARLRAVEQDGGWWGWEMCADSSVTIELEVWPVVGFVELRGWWCPWWWKVEALFHHLPRVCFSGMLGHACTASR